MAVQKSRKSKSRRNMRRSQWKRTAPALSTCSNCGSTCQPHRVCPTCGYYKGKQVLVVNKAA